MTESALNHPGDEALRALSMGKLAETEIGRVSAHLGDCPLCCRRIDQLATDDALMKRLKKCTESREVVLVTPAERRSAVRALRQANVAKPDSKPVIHSIPREIGDYEILGEVGRGGMGVVYKVRHRGLQRLAALKMVLAGEYASRSQGVRFRLEAELAARVLHPNIVQVYEIGDCVGRPYLAMEWVEGGNLADKLDGKPWSPAEAASLIETLARAIHVAHGEGVVHRDLKPANIMLTADGTPKITDFGLAQPLENSEALTRTGFLVGTPGYMAPEQATGNRALIGPATDLYALGVMLYQLSTGQLPFQADNTLELLKAVASDEPVRPRRLQPGLPRDLEAITLHCLEKAPGHRYPSAMSLAEDLRRFREGTPVEARPVGAVARLARTARRRPMITLLLTLLAMSVFAGLGGVTWKWLEANAQRDLANAEKQAAQYQAYRASLAAASAALENHDVATAARHLGSAPEDLRGWEWHHLHSRLDDSTSEIPLTAEGGMLIAAPDRVRVGAWTREGLRITDLDGGGGLTVPVSPERRTIVQVAQTHQGLRIATSGLSASIEVLNEAGHVLCRILPTDSIHCNAIAISADGRRLARARTDRVNQIDEFDLATGKLTASCRGDIGTTWALTYSPDGSRLASGGEDRTLRVWDAETGEPLSESRGHSSKIVSAAFNADGSRLVTTSSDGMVRQWDARTGGEAEPPYDRHSSEVFSAVYSPDGQYVASTGADRTVRVWKASGREDIAVLHGHTGRVAQVAFVPDGRRLATLSCKSVWINTGDDTTRVWDVDPTATLPVLRGHTKTIYPLAFSHDGRWLASASFDGTVRLWDAATGEPRSILNTPFHKFGMAFGPDGMGLVTGSEKEDRLQVWDVATACVRREIPFLAKDVHSLVVNADGSRMAVANYVGEQKMYLMTVYDTATGMLLYSTFGTPLAYSADGHWLAASSGDEKTVLLLNAQTHEVSASFTGHEGRVIKAVFSPDGCHLASCSKDSTVRLWPINGGECRVFRGHTDEVYAVAFHPDGTRLATGCQDGTVWLWDLARGEDVLRLPGHKSFVWSVAFSPDGRTLASASGDSTIRLWDTAPVKDRYKIRRSER